MPTVSWSTPIEHSSDATFRAWGSDLSTRFATAGLVQTTDTGQINWVTATRPGAIAFAGYEIWRFNDTLQATSPVFIKVEYGTANNTTVPALRITVSSGTDGAGTPTGLVTTARLAYTATTLIANANITNFPSFLCATAGFSGLSFKAGAASSSNLTLIGFTVQRTVDNTGAPTATAVVLTTCGATNNATTAALVSIINYTASTVDNSSSGIDLGAMPSAMTASIVGTSPQVFLHWTSVPQVTPLVGTASYILSEVVLGSERDITLVGSTPRHYIAIGNALRKTAYNGSAAVIGTLMLWET